MQVTIKQENRIRSFGIGRAATAGDLQKLIRTNDDKATRNLIMSGFFAVSAAFMVYALPMASSKNDKVLAYTLIVAAAAGTYVSLRRRNKASKIAFESTNKLNELFRKGNTYDFTLNRS